MSTNGNIKPTDLPPQYQTNAKTLNKALQEIFRIIQSTDVNFNGQAKASRIAEVHLVMQDAITSIEQLLSSGIGNTEQALDAIISKPFVPEEGQ